MATFRLVKGAGPHKQGGRIYTAGQAVNSDDNLVELFRGKFELVSGSKEAPEGKSETHTPFDTDQTKKALAGVTFEEGTGAGDLESEESETDSGPAEVRASRRTNRRGR